MATNKPIISVIVEKKLRNKLEEYAQENRISLSKAAAYFIEKGIECEKDEDKRFLCELLDIFPEIVWVKDSSLRYTYVNRAFLNVLGLSKKEEVIGKTDIEVLPEDLAKTSIYSDMLVLNTGEPFTEIESSTSKDLYLEVNKIPIKKDGKIIGILGVAKDITNEIKVKEDLLKTQEQLKELLTEVSTACDIDYTTGIANRHRFIETLRNVLNSINKYNQTAYLILVDIYNFKYFNELHGIETGNFLLKKLAEELKKLIGNIGVEYILARTGEDEFGIIIKGNINIKKFTNFLRNTLQHIYVKDRTGRSIKLPEVFIIAYKLYPSKDFNPERLLVQLEIELSKAKNSVHQQPIIIKEDDLNTYTQLEDKLYDAIENGKIIPYAQGIYSSNDKTLLGYEVLFRIEDEEKIIPAEEVLFSAYTTGLILSIDRVILKHINQVKNQLDKHLFLNLSYFTVFSSETNPHDITELLISLRNVASFEISEIDFMENLKTIKNISNRYNLDIVLDNFGIKECPFKLIIDLYNDKIISMLKFDRQLITKILENPAHDALVKAAVDLSRSFGIKTIAVGVENKDIYHKVKSIGVDYCQGFYLDYPKKLSEVIV